MTSKSSYRLGKLSPTPIAFKLSKYGAALPAPPKLAGHVGLADSNMFANDRLGDCVCAGAGHETLLWNQLGGKTVTVTDQNVIAMYEAVAGYNPADPSTDQGTDMAAAASWRRKTGLADAAGTRHKIGAYVAIDKGNRTELMQAIWLFGAAGVGIQFPASAMTQFDAGKPWTVVKGSKIEGGHYVAAVGYDSAYIYVITWGKLQRMTWAFFDKYNDEGFAYLSTEFIKAGKSPEGFDLTTLQSDLAAL